MSNPVSWPQHHGWNTGTVQGYAVIGDALGAGLAHKVVFDGGWTEDLDLDSMPTSLVSLLPRGGGADDGDEWVGNTVPESQNEVDLRLG
jgi:hypothetical protein